MRGSFIKNIMIILGTLSLVIGAIGIFIPVLPTTPLLLLSAYFYLRGSRRHYDWLLNHRIFGMYIYNYINYRAVLLSTKIFSFILLWASLAISMALIEMQTIRFILILVGVSVSIHLYLLKTLSKEQMKDMSVGFISCKTSDKQ